jgi:outer membrane lipoprotein
MCRLRYIDGMNINWIRVVAVLWWSAAMITGCASHVVVPEALEAQLAKDVTFAQILAAPESFIGKRIVIGGEVLKAKRTEAGTLIEVLQLPLNADYEPTLVRTDSQGRFLALAQDLLDPATIRKGTAVTLVGEVTGARMDRLDEVEYRYPTFGVKHLYVWPPEYAGDRRSGISIGMFGGMGIGGGSRGGEGSDLDSDRLLRRPAGHSYDRERLTVLSRRCCITEVRRMLKLHTAEPSTAGL